MGKLLLSSGGEEVSNSPRKFSATLKKASLVTKIKDKIGTDHFFKGHFTFTHPPAPFRILIKKPHQNHMQCCKSWQDMVIPSTVREKSSTPPLWEDPGGRKCGVPSAATAPLAGSGGPNEHGSFQTSGAIPWSHSIIHHCSFHSSSEVYASRISFLSIAYPIFSNLTLLQPKYRFKETLLPSIFMRNVDLCFIFWPVTIFYA